MELMNKPIAAICKCLADENRLRILQILGREKKSVTQIVEALELSQPLVSHHLKELRRNHLLKVEREGPFVYYQVKNNGIMSILKKMDEMARDIIENHEPF
jgi:DNA-binding transcriptional ArsR family regulator